MQTGKQFVFDKKLTSRTMNKTAKNKTSYHTSVGAKIILPILLLGLAVAILLYGCSKKANTSSETGNSNAPLIVTTIFPEYDWVMNILGDNPANARVVLLADNGVDLHSFQPSAEDILTISDCDVFVYVGGESDQWVDKALKNARNENMIVVNLMDVLGDRAALEECVEGMQDDEDEHHHSDEEGENHNPDADSTEEESPEDDEGPEYDEHVWLSLRNAGILCDSIENAIQTVDPDHAQIYIDNLNHYKEKLTELDNRYSETVNTAPYDTLLFGDRFPFRYMTDDYNLNYYAAFKGCSAESEATFDTILFLSGKVDELSLPAVCIIDGSDGRIADTVIKSSSSDNVSVVRFDSMQSVTADEIKNGVSYLSVMEDNLTALQTALGLQSDYSK